MRILQINTHAGQGGAGRVMCRLHHALNRRGHRSRIVARSRAQKEANVYCLDDVTRIRPPVLMRIVRGLGWRIDKWFDVPTLHLTTRRLLASRLFQTSDVIHLHNLHGRYFNYHLLPALTAAKPTVWTLHDMWAFTGHCAYSYECDRWRKGCHHCPLLKPNKRALVEPGPTLVDRTRQVWRRKRVIYRHSRFSVVTPSRWLQRLAQESIVGEGRTVHFIPNGVDLEVFKPIERVQARAHFGIPQEARVILFAAEKTTSKRKGFLYLLQALDRLRDPAVVLVVMGKPSDRSLPPRFRVVELGFIQDEVTQSLAYNAADLFVFPSLADNQPLVLIEALACGTPVVAFDAGGIPEMVRHMETGYLARYKDAADLSHGIETLLNDEEMHCRMRIRCRQIAEAEYGLDLQAERYLELYEQILQRGGWR